MEELSALGTVTRRSPVIASAAIGPARRRFANAVAALESDLTPPELLGELKRLERGFGRRRGQAWGDRVLDCDIVLWSAGAWRLPDDPAPGLRAAQLRARPGLRDCARLARSCHRAFFATASRPLDPPARPA